MKVDDLVKGKDAMESSVYDILLSKHPELVNPDEEAFEEYPEVPEMVTLDITLETVQKVASKLSRAAGPGGVDSMALQ